MSRGIVAQSVTAIPASIHALLTAYFCPGGSTLSRGDADQVSRAAIAAIDAGLDAPTLGVLAGLTGSLNPFEMEALFRDLMKELGIVIDDFERVVRPNIDASVAESDVDPEPVARSVYLIELSNGPGGASLAHVHAYATLAELKRIIAYYFEDHADLLAMYSQPLMALWVVRSGKLVGHIDLRAFLDAGSVLDWKRLRAAIPALQGKRAVRGDLLAIGVGEHEGVPGSYLPFGEIAPLELRYGWNDLQYDEPPPDDWPG